MIFNSPEFKDLRNPDGTVNKAILAAQGLTPTGFIERVRQAFALRQVTSPIETSAIAGAAAPKLAFDALLQQREVQLQRFEAKDFLAQIMKHWTTPIAPFRVIDNIYYVGTAGIAVFTIFALGFVILTLPLGLWFTSLSRRMAVQR